MYKTITNMLLQYCSCFRILFNAHLDKYLKILINLNKKAYTEWNNVKFNFYNLLNINKD